MRLSPKIHQILDILSDGRFHSGELIGQAIGISRERVSVYIRELRSKGVQVFSLQRKGYSLPAPAELLDEKRPHLGLPLREPVHLQHVLEVRQL